MSKKQPLEPSGSKTPEEIAKGGSAAILAALEAHRKRAREEYEKEVLDAVRLLDEPKRDGLPEFYRQPQEHKGTLRFSSPTEPLYRRLPDDIKEWRNPDSDFWMAEWMRGVAISDHGKMLLASAKLEELFPRAVMTEGTAPGTGAVGTGTGGELAPRPLEAVIYINRDRVAKMRRFATIYQMTAHEHNVPTVDSMTAAMVSEATGSGQSEPGVAQVPLIAQVAGVSARWTRELEADSAYNLVTIISERGGRALGVLEDNEFFKDGTGTKPHVTKLSGTGYALTTATALAYTDVLGIYHTCAQQYRDNAVWFISSSVLQLMGNVRDGNGRPFYQGLIETPGPITDDPGAVGRILRKPVYEVPLTSGDIWFGDPSQYLVGDRQGITIEISRHAMFTRRQVVAEITERIAGNNGDTAAAQYTTAIASASSL